MINIFKNLTKKQWLMVVVSLGLICLQVWIDLKLPEFTSKLADMFNRNNITLKKVLIQGIYLLLCALASAGVSVVIGLLAALIGAGLSQTLRTKVFDKVQSYSMREIKKFSCSSLINRTTSDIRQVQGIVAMGMQAIVKAPILAIWGICKILNKSWNVSILVFIAVVILVVVMTCIMLYAIPRFRKIQTLFDNLNRVSRENLVGIKVVRAFNAEDYEAEKFEDANKKLSQNDLEAHRVMGLMWPSISVIMNLLTLGIYVMIAFLINKAPMMEKFTLMSDIWVYTSWSIQIVSAFMTLVFVCMMLPRVLVSVRRINEVLNTNTTIKDGEGAQTDEIGKVEFKNVSFHYPDTDEACLKDISFKCNKGDVVAIIGATGSGKTTLINLIPRFYDTISGEVLVDGENVKNYKLDDLHNKIGYISQKATLFKGSILDNVSMGDVEGKKPTIDDVNQAIDISQMSDFVEELDTGLDYEITQGATNVSGGQKQRISIARAISRKPEILIFDDSFSALDYRTDKNLRSQLAEKLKDTTCFIVAQRISTIKNADLIIILDEGKIVGMGKHKDLLENCDIYKEIALSQLNQEELNG